MLTFRARMILQQFTAGTLSREQFDEQLNRYLFDIRQDPDLESCEEHALSGIELILHEAFEGFRSWDELLPEVTSVLEADMVTHS